MKTNGKTAVYAAIPTLVLALAPPVEAQLTSFQTDHYVISYFPGAEGTARRVAEVAEEVFAPLAAAYGYYDDYSPIHIVVLDNSDFGNGAADNYSNTVYIWASALDWEIRGDHPWIKNVLTHEISHVMTLDKARKRWPFRVALFSVSRFDSNPDISFNFPVYYLNTPAWWVEGIAQFAPTHFGWDTWDSHRDMLLRMAVLEDDLSTLNEMGGLSHRAGGYRAEQVYNQGFGLLMYTAATYGAEKVEELQDNVGSLSFDPAIRKVLGISADQLYDDWVRFMEDQYGQQVKEILAEGFFEGNELGDVNQGVIDYHPSYSPDGRKLAYITSQNRDYRIPYVAIYDFVTRKKKVLKEFVDTRISWFPDSDKILFLRNKSGYNDLFVYDLEKDEEHRISAGLRARDPNVSPDGERIAFVRIRDGNHSLCLIDADGTDLVQLTNHNDRTQIYAPRWSPDGEWILFSIFSGKDRDIAMMRADSPPLPKKTGLRPPKDDTPDSLKVFPDSLAFPAADTSGFTPLLASSADERDPYWLFDGSGFVFSCDRTGIFNIYQYILATGEVRQLTNVLGGAFSPTVSSDGRVTYSSYHANNFDLYEFDLDGAGERTVHWDPLANRDYQTVVRGPKLSEDYSVFRYRGRRVLDIIPLFQVGPTFIGNTFGLNQISGGAQVSVRETLGGDVFTFWGVLGKNFRQSTDLNTDFGIYAERRLLPAVGNNRTFNPTLWGGWRRRETDFVNHPSYLNENVSDSPTTFYVPVDSTTNLLIPNAISHGYQREARKYLYKYVFQMWSLGVDLPLSRRQRLTALYTNRNYDENWLLHRLRQRVEIFVIQDSLDITASLPRDATSSDTTPVTPDEPFTFFDDMDFFTSNDLTLAWNYRRIKPTADRMINATGRSMAFIYRYMKSNLADSLAYTGDGNLGDLFRLYASWPVAVSPRADDGMPRDVLVPARRPLTVNEYVGAYTERVGLPFRNTLTWEVVAAYRNLRLKPPFDLEGGFFEGRYYWPLRYYLGGRNFLSGYPYFVRSGSKLLYGRFAYGFPLFRRLDLGFLNFNFTKVYAELFAETGAVGNFRTFKLENFDSEAFLSDVGGEVRMELYTFYRIPMRVFFQVAHPLDRDRELAPRLGAWEMEQNQLPPDLRSDENRPVKIDKWRFYFGLGLVGRGL